MLPARFQALLIALLFIALSSRAAAELDSRELADLRYMREEEKLARDLYNAFHARWGSALFYNIAVSEQRHADAVVGLLQDYGVSDPAAGLAPGVFADAALQGVYNTLAARGAASELAALGVAIEVEEEDIADLDAALARTDEIPVQRVYRNLRKGSQNHLAAFSSRLQALGGTVPASPNGLNPGVSVYEPLSRTLYIPAIDVTNASGAVVVYDALLRLVEALPQAVELVAANVTTKAPNPIHASYDLATGIVSIPQLRVGSLAITSIEDRTYALELIRVTGANTPQLFSVAELRVVE